MLANRAIYVRCERTLVAVRLSYRKCHKESLWTSSRDYVRLRYTLRLIIAQFIVDVRVR